MNKGLIPLGVKSVSVTMNPLSGYTTPVFTIPGRVTETTYQLRAQTRTADGADPRPHLLIRHDAYAVGERPTDARDEQQCREMIASVREMVQANFPGRRVTDIA